MTLDELLEKARGISNRADRKHDEIREAMEWGTCDDVAECMIGYSDDFLELIQTYVAAQKA